ncbi:hypothetical protein Q5P01_024846 [Channa striata]|uniref:Uncharacterized protein n=1 Tax=Channa striata TaxID=64152 RepID=A0AA88J8G3_CHASR|nr:hypothetical protein Q5P01_024846 [Channa striata]
MADKLTPVTECLMECTGMTYIRKLQLQDSHNIRLRDSTEGDLGEYCWSTELKCTVGESFHSAYVLVPVDVSAVGPEQLEVRVTAPAAPAASTLRADRRASTIADTCGLRYDAGEQFSTDAAGTWFCIQVVTPDDDLGDKVLKCPPYLVTFWQRSPTSQRGDG